MNESQISVRYAKALFQSALESDIPEKVYRDMEILHQTCRLKDFQFMLVHPSLKVSRKSQLVDSILGDHLTGISMGMVQLVIRNNREEYLQGIARYYRDLYREFRGIRSAKLVTAQIVEEAVLNKIRSLITKTFDSEVELSAGVDESIIGGFVLTIEDQQYDASVSTGLRKLKKQLLDTRIEKP